MKKVAETAISILGLYLIISAMSELAHRSWGLSSSAALDEYLFMFGPSIILSTGGLLCLLFRGHISGWILKWQDFEVPEHIDLSRIECIVLSLIGILVLFEIIPYFILSVNNFLLSPEVQETEYGDLPLRSYAFVQVIAVGIELVLSLTLILLPKKVQTVLSRIRGF